MEILIWIVISLFRWLFGETEEQPDMTPTTKRTFKRGPLDYGDGRSGGPAPKTLEEILAEVRADQQRKQTGTPQTEEMPAPPVAQIPVERPKKKKKAKRPQPEVAPVPAPRKRLSESEALPSEEGRRVATLETLAKLERLRQEPQTDQMAQVATLKRLREEPNLALVAQIEGPKRMRKLARSGDAEPKPADGAVAAVGILAALKSQKPEERLTAARQAFVLQEIFGTPRCRKPWRAQSSRA